MQRSIGVITNAVLSLIGSGLVLVVGILTLIVMVFAMRSAPLEAPKEFPLPPVFLKAFMLAIPLMYLLPGIWGICTGIGLLRLKNWARISIIIFASLLTFYGFFEGLGALAFTLVQLPNTLETDPAAMTIARTVMVLMAVLQLGLGTFWLVFFNRGKVAAQFRPLQPVRLMTPAFPPPPSSVFVQGAYVAPLPSSPAQARPISTTIIGWYLLAICALSPANLILRPPVPLFTWILTGWSSFLFVLATVGLMIYTGVGLLKLWPLARFIGMAYFVFTLVNSAIFCFTPGGYARIGRLIDAQWSMFPWMKQLLGNFPFSIDLKPFFMVALAMGMAITLVPVYFLYTNKAAFEKAKPA